MNIILMLLVFVSVTAFTNECKIKSPKEYVVFVDVNLAQGEIEAATKAACERSMGIKIIPPRTELTKKVINARKEYIYLYRLHRNCKQSSADQCDLAEQKMKNAKTQLDEITLKYKPNMAEELYKGLNDIKQSEVKSLVISGHNGGSKFASDEYLADFSISKDEIHQIFSKFPKMLSQVEGLYLLGCYTTVDSAILDWFSLFPNITVMGGYLKKGPLQDRVAGHRFLHDLLMAEEDLKMSSSIDKLMSHLSQVRHLNDVDAGILLSPVCQNKKSYYNSIKRTLSDYDPGEECQAAWKKYDSVLNTIKSYYFGSKNPPINTGSGQLREAYEFSRQYGHCFENVINDPENETQASSTYDLLSDADKLMMLLFFDNYKSNFSRAMNYTEGKFEKYVDDITLKDLEASLDRTYSGIEKRLDEIKNNLESFIENPSSRRQKLEEKILTVNNELNGLKNKGASIFDLANDPIYSSLNIRLRNLKRELNIIDGDPEVYRSSYESEIKLLEAQIEQKNSLLSSFKEDKERLKGSLWTPTQQNLKSKDRKQILDLANDINRFTSKYGSYSYKLKDLEKELKYIERGLVNLDCYNIDWYKNLQTPEKPLCLGGKSSVNQDFLNSLNGSFNEVLPRSSSELNYSPIDFDPSNQ